jgi:hypothetical protein
MSNLNQVRNQVSIMSLPGTCSLANSILSHLNKKDIYINIPELMEYDYNRFPD